MAARRRVPGIEAMQTVLNAGSRDRTIFDDAPKAQTEQQIAAERCAPRDAMFETAARWLYRITFVVAPACYVARLMKVPFAGYLMEATAFIVIALLLHTLAGYLLKRMHLVSDACFDRPASLRRRGEDPASSTDALSERGMSAEAARDTDVHG
jgi:hypothetical protein